MNHPTPTWQRRHALLALALAGLHPCAVLAQAAGFDHSHAAWTTLLRKHVVLLRGGQASPVSYTHLLSGSGLAALIRDEARHRLLEQLPIAMVCVAQRLADRAVVGFSRGDLGLAVQAASAIEGQFTPVRIRGQPHADADLVMPLPVRLARALGATRVLAVDASAHEDRAPAGTERWRPGDLRKRALTQPDAALADVLLHPDLG